MNKYGNKRVWEDGIEFASKLERDRYIQLKLLQKAGEIKDLKTQVQYVLQPAFEKRGKKYRPITYIADFEYYNVKTRQVIVEDTKGKETDVFRNKRKMFEYKYPDLTLEILTRKDM